MFAITIDAEARVDYIIEIDCGWYSDLEHGILEEEITLLGADTEAAD